MFKKEARRLFFALNLPKSAKDIIAEATKKIKTKYQDINWVNPDNYHITLQFLGNCQESFLKKAKAIALSQANQYGDFEFSIGGFNAFPNLKNPRVLFLACEQINNRKTFLLYKNLELKLIENGFDLDNRLWTPHITVARIKEKIKLPTNLNYQINLRFTVKTFELMESILGPAGPQYYIIQSVKL